MVLAAFSTQYGILNSNFVTLSQNEIFIHKWPDVMATEWQIKPPWIEMNKLESSDLPHISNLFIVEIEQSQKIGKYTNSERSKKRSKKSELWCSLGKQTKH